MHTKMRLRVKAMELVVKQARREEDESKQYKDKHGGEQITETKEVKRKEEVFKFKWCNLRGKSLFVLRLTLKRKEFHGWKSKFV